MTQFIKRYQIRWCLILITVLLGGTLLPRLSDITLLQFVANLVLGFCYFFVCWLIQAYFRVSYNGKLTARGRAVVSILLSILFCLGLNYLEELYIPKEILKPEIAGTFTFNDFLKRLVASFFASMINFIVLNTVFTNNLLQETQLENERLKQADLRAILNSLQQQISPHFLFNSLSTLKNIATDAETKKFVIQLSHVYRYLLSLNDHHLTTVKQEIKFIESYIYILRERFDDALHVIIQVPDRYFDYQIPPLSLQLLIENAIKHNAFSEDMPLYIKVYIDDRERLTVSNNLQPKKHPEISTKLGLQNINDRCKLLLDKCIDVVITDDSFTVNLPIVKNESSNH